MLVFKMKIQPLDSSEMVAGNETMKPLTATRSRIMRIIEKQFPKRCVIGYSPEFDSGDGDFDLSSVCLDKMVKNFIEQSNNINHEKQESPSCFTITNCSRRRCNCFNGDDGDNDSAGDGNDEAFDILKDLVQCANVNERNLLADVANIVEKNKSCKRKDDVCRKIVTDGLASLGYNASVCKSRWDKTPSFPAGEYEYIDVMSEGERLIIDIDFRSEFEIARSSKSYKRFLQILPLVFVGKSDRLQRIIELVTGAAKRSLEKKGMDFPPWRKAEYVRSKWLSPLQVTKVHEFKVEKAAAIIRPRVNAERNGVKQIITGFKL